MKSSIQICILLFLFYSSLAQDAEVKALNSAFNLYNAFQNGKVDSLPANEKNYNKVVAHLDNSFKAFISHKKSQDYEKFVLAKGHTNYHFFRLENGTEIGYSSFLVDSVTYVAFGYKILNRPQYFIKRLSDHKIVFDGHAHSSSVDGMYAIEKNRILLVEKDGDYNTSRKASVIATEGKQWKQLKAFKGKAFGQVDADYFNKRFVAARTYFQLECDIDVSMMAPRDANQIMFNEKTQTIGYKLYKNDSQFKKIEAKYEDGFFIIDDYNVGDGIRTDNTAVPR
jgi:hypothetical protein